MKAVACTLGFVALLLSACASVGDADETSLEPDDESVGTDEAAAQHIFMKCYPIAAETDLCAEKGATRCANVSRKCSGGAYGYPITGKTSKTTKERAVQVCMQVGELQRWATRTICSRFTGGNSCDSEGGAHCN